MGTKTGIQWTTHTFNPWIGCTMVSAGCSNCYAARDNKRYKWVDEWNSPPKRTSESNWKKPLEWARSAAKDRELRRIFCASLADVFDVNAPQEWREDLWNLINETGKLANGYLEWLILTKRPENIKSMWSNRVNFTPFVRLGITTENQLMANERIPVFLDAWEGKNFISYEPAIGKLSLEKWMRSTTPAYKPLIDWVIIGCESGSSARTTEDEWVRTLIDEITYCNEEAHSLMPFRDPVKTFVKQLMVDGKLTKMPEFMGRVWDEFPEY